MFNKASNNLVGTIRIISVFMAIVMLFTVLCGCDSVKLVYGEYEETKTVIEKTDVSNEDSESEITDNKNEVTSGDISSLDVISKPSFQDTEKDHNVTIPNEAIPLRKETKEYVTAISGKVFYLKDYLQKDEKYYDEAFKRALKDIKDLDGKSATLLLPSGEMNLKTSVDLSGISNLIIKGQKTNVWVHSPNTLFTASKSNNITISDLEIDYSVVNFTMGVLKECKGREYTVKINEGYEFSEDMNVGSFLEFDPLTNSPRNNGNAVYAWGDVEDVSIVSEEERTLKITFKEDEELASPAPEGTIILVSQTPFGPPGVSFSYCNNLVFRNLLWYMAPGMGMWVNDTDNVTIENVDFVRNTKTDRMFSACRDGMHILNCAGTVKITDCYLENLGDDGLNIHSNWFSIRRAIDDYTVVVNLNDGDTTYARRNSVGDVIQFRDGNLQIIDTAVLKKVVDTGNTLTFTFDKKVTAKMRACNLYNLTRSPRLTYENNVVANSRGHGVLVQTDAQSVVRNNKFINNYYNGIKIATGLLESTAAANLVIENNYIGGYCYMESLGDILLTSWAGGDIKPGIFENITIRNNVIEKAESVGASIIAKGIEGLIIENNKISNVGKPLREGDGISDICGIWISGSNDVVIRGNEIKTNGSAKEFYNIDKDVTNVTLTK